MSDIWVNILSTICPTHQCLPWRGLLHCICSIQITTWSNKNNKQPLLPLSIYIKSLLYLFIPVCFLDWTPVHSERQLVKVVGHVVEPEEKYSLPQDIDQHPFSKFTNIYFKVCYVIHEIYLVPVVESIII